MNVKTITNPKTGKKVQLLANPMVREKYLLKLWDEFPEKSKDELLYLAEIEAQKTGKMNYFVVKAKKMAEFKKKFQVD